MKKILSSLILSLFFLMLPCFSIAFDDDIARYARYENSFDSYDGPPLTWQEITYSYLIFFGIIWCIAHNSKKKAEKDKMFAELEAQRKESEVYDSQYYAKRKSLDLESLKKDIDIARENKLEINFSYKDIKGNLSYRRTIPLERYQKYGKEYVRCFDLDKQAERNFILTKIRDLIVKD